MRATGKGVVAEGSGAPRHKRDLPDASARRAIIRCVTERFNLHTAETALDGTEREGYFTRGNRFAKQIGAAGIGGTVYDLPPGESICPYHYEYDEEWLFVLTGNPVVRHPNGETRLDPGDVVCFPRGPDGAHKVTNPAEATGESRVLMISTLGNPAVAYYPDSNKIGVFTDDHRLLVHSDSGVDYWDGEP